MTSDLYYCDITVASEQHLYQTLVQCDKTIVLPRKLATGRIDDYIFCQMFVSLTKNKIEPRCRYIPVLNIVDYIHYASIPKVREIKAYTMTTYNIMLGHSILSTFYIVYGYLSLGIYS